MYRPKWGGDRIGLGFTLSLLDNGEEGRGQVSRDLLLFRGRGGGKLSDLE